MVTVNYSHMCSSGIYIYIYIYMYIYIYIYIYIYVCVCVCVCVCVHLHTFVYICVCGGVCGVMATGVWNRRGDSSSMIKLCCNISHRINTLEKGTNPTILSPAIDK